MNDYLERLTAALSDRYRIERELGSQKFLMIRGSQKNAQTLGVVLNWASEIKRLSTKK